MLGVPRHTTHSEENSVLFCNSTVVLYSVTGRWFLLNVLMSCLGNITEKKDTARIQFLRLMKSAGIKNNLNYHSFIIDIHTK